MRLDSTVKIWNIKEKREEKVLTSKGSWVEHVAFTSDSKYIISCSTDSNFRIWDVQKHRLESNFTDPESVYEWILWYTETHINYN